MLQIKKEAKFNFTNVYMQLLRLYVGPKSAKQHCWLDCLFLRICDLHV